MREYYLTAKFDNRNQFYGKARVIEDESMLKLISYNTHVAGIIKGGKPYVIDTYSATTLRHIKEFLKQNGFKATSKAQIEDDYIK